MGDFQKLWALIKADLGRARNLLPASADDQHGLLALYSELLEQNELEAACDALEDFAMGRVVSPEFWVALRDAATKMQLREHASRYEQHAGRS